MWCELIRMTSLSDQHKFKPSVNLLNVHQIGGASRWEFSICNFYGHGTVVYGVGLKEHNASHEVTDCTWAPCSNTTAWLQCIIETVHIVGVPQLPQMQRKFCNDFRLISQNGPLNLYVILHRFGRVVTTFRDGATSDIHHSRKKDISGRLD